MSFVFYLFLISEMFWYFFCLATVKAVEHRGGDQSSSCIPGSQQDLQTQAGQISKPYSEGELNAQLSGAQKGSGLHLFLFLMCSFFQFAANVHLLCAKLQVHITQCTAHDQLYAANFNWDVLSGHTSNIHARFHLYSTNGHPPQERYDHEEKGRLSCVATFKTFLDTLLWSLYCVVSFEFVFVVFMDFRFVLWSCDVG